MTFTKLETAPAETALAVNSPQHNLHGHKPHIIEMMRYWGKVRKETRGTEDTTRFDIAATLGSRLRDLSWRLTFDDDPHFIATDEFSLDYAKKNFEPARRQLLGIVALSDLTKLLIDKEEGLISNVDTATADKNIHMILDVYTDEGYPFNPRVHLSPIEADALLDQPPGDDAESWYVNDDGLIIKRTALDMSPSMGMHVQIDDYTLASQNTQTLFPYLPAQPNS
jgi:hypothetical protein